MLGSLISPILTIINKLIPDKTVKSAQLTSIILADKKLAAVDSQNSNIFISGSRPFLRWIVGSILLYQLGIRPIMTGLGYQLPGIELNDLVHVLSATIGIGI